MASALFFVGVWLRRLFLSTRSQRRSLVTPTVTVGNVTVGGTGKTPFVMLLLRHLRGHVGYVTRGYRRSERKLYLAKGSESTPSQAGDEAVLIGRRFPSTTIAVCESKWEAVQTLDGQCDLMVIDDGLQRYDIPMHVKVATIDCGCPDGYGWLLPRGLLREPFSWLANADYLVITNADETLAPLRQRLEPFRRPTIVTRPTIERFFAPDGSTHIVSPGQEMALFSGIARPERFRELMERGGYAVVDHLVFPDHGEVAPSIFESWIASVRVTHPRALIIGTEKDWARHEQWSHHDVLFSQIGLTIIEGHEEFGALCSSLSSENRAATILGFR
jgi:tetraacyldisaccharide 4'-kinase